MANNRELSQFGNYISVNDTSKTIGINTDITVSDVVTAKTFYGDGTNLTGIVKVGGAASLGITSSTSLYVSGISSLTNLVVSGVSTLGSLSASSLNVSGISTLGGLSASSLSISGSTSLSDLRVSGVSTLGIVSASSLNVSGITTLTNLRVSGVSTLGIVSASSLNVSGVATVADLRTNTLALESLRVSGVSTLGIVSASSLNVSGISTFGKILLNPSGIITATSGIVTYYGDGSKLLNVVSIAGVGINTVGGNIGYGATILDFRGSGISTISLSVGIATINIKSIDPNDGVLLLGVSGNGLSGSSSFTANQSTTSTFTVSSNATTENTGSTLVFRDPDGGFSAGIVTAIDFNSTSDSTLKENIKTIENSLEIVNQLRGVSFDWKMDNKSSYGVVAQEIENILPELVSNTNPKTVNYNGIIGVLIEAVKQLSLKVNELESKSK
jgi:hypothetical protein